MHFQLIPLQILFINIVTDVLPALALGVGGGRGDVMKQNPRNPKQPLMDGRQWKAILIYPVVITIFVMGAVWISHHTVANTEEMDQLLCNSILFFTLIYTQLFHVFNMTFGWVSPIRSEVVRNKYVWYALAICAALTWVAYSVYPVNRALHIHPMSWASMALILGASFGSMITIQLLKRLKLTL
jgi:Ca2+-transporting ATPase